MDTIRIFIASSSELKTERQAFREFLSVENDRLHKKGGYLELVQWEHFLDTISHTRLQDEYNSELKKCDIVVCLFYTKAGKYTLEEFEVALKQFKETGKPLIYTYFKSVAQEEKSDSPGEGVQELKKFKQYLADIGHFFTTFKSIGGLKYHFRRQLDLLEDKGILFLKEETQRKISNTLPEALANNLISDRNHWVKSLRREFLKLKVSVGNKDSDIFQHYGWLIEIFLQKMATGIGQKRTLRSFSFMTEAFQSSLRYLSFIQVAQILQIEDLTPNPMLSEFLSLHKEEYLRFDYLNLLVTATNLLENTDPFVPKITSLVEELTNSKKPLYQITLFLEKHRRRLVEHSIQEDDSFARLFDEYLTALVYWLRKIAFLAKFKLVSIKDINLNYRLGTSVNFVHKYAELNGIYSDLSSEDFKEAYIENVFTFNKSVLLLNEMNLQQSLKEMDKESILSLSPLIIDQSVLTNKLTQTPEIYYFIGKENYSFRFAQFKNELPLGENSKIRSNKIITIKENNLQKEDALEKYDELFEQLEIIFEPFTSETL